MDWMGAPMISWVGDQAISQVTGVVSLIKYTGQVFWSAVWQIARGRFRFRVVLDQVFRMAVQGLPVIVTALIFISLMLVVEFSFHMRLVIREDSLVPAFSTVLMIRELGPVVTCMLLASRVGAAISAEIGTMVLTDQVDALKLLNIDPIEFLAVPRLIGCLIASVCLSVVAVGVAVLAGAYLAAERMHYMPSQFLNTMFAFTHWNDLTACVIKGAVFGMIIPIVASRRGFQCEPGAEGVGNAATAAVVDSFILIIMADFLLTYCFYAV
jgi:phospholipid/cholesterol/gamma-HCH transport system permease protein